MGTVRALRRFLVPAAGTAKVVGTTTYVGADIVKAVAQGSSAGMPSVLGVLPGFAIVKGIFDIANGLGFAFDNNEPDAEKPSEQRYQSIGVYGSMAETADEDPTDENFDDPQQVTRPTLPILPIDRYQYSPTARFIRGGLQTISGAFLLDGGIEALRGTDTFHLNNALGGSHSLLWRMAISSYVDFALSFHDLWKILRNHEEYNTGMLSYADFASEVGIKALNAAGWTALAMCGAVGLPFGMACLTLATLAAVLKHHKEIIPTTLAFWGGAKDAVYNSEVGFCPPLRRKPSMSSS